MNIFANTAVTISFKLFDANNKLIEESPERLSTCTAATRVFSRRSRLRSITRWWVIPFR